MAIKTHVFVYIATISVCIYAIVSMIYSSTIVGIYRAAPIDEVKCLSPENTKMYSKINGIAICSSIATLIIAIYGSLVILYSFTMYPSRDNVHTAIVILFLGLLFNGIVFIVAYVNELYNLINDPLTCKMYQILLIRIFVEATLFFSFPILFIIILFARSMILICESFKYYYYSERIDE